MDFIQILLGGGVGAAIATGVFILGNTLISKKVVSPTDKVAAEAAANDLIFRLLDRANDEIARYEKLIEDLTTKNGTTKKERSELVIELQAQLERVTNERDRLSIAINRLRQRAQKMGHLTYTEIVVWANNALDPDVPLNEFEDLGPEEETVLTVPS